MDLIRIEGLELRCIVGLRSYERHREQALRVEIALGLDLSSAGRSGRIGDSVDYSRVADSITALLRFREYRLLEVASEEAAALLFAAHPVVQMVRIRLDKPEALAGRARTAAVEIQRSRGAFGTTREVTEAGIRTVLLRTEEAVIEVLELPAGRSLSLKSPDRRLEWLTHPAESREALHHSPCVYEGGVDVEYREEGPGALHLVRCSLTEPSR